MKVECPQTNCNASVEVNHLTQTEVVTCPACGCEIPTPDPMTRGDATGPMVFLPWPMPLAPGSRFGRFTIETMLGRGGMGEVYLAKDPHHVRKIALKVPRLRESDNAGLCERFRREIQICSQLEHSNICTIYDADVIEDRPYFSMRYIDGKTLTAVADRGTPGGVRDAVNLVRKVALALDYAHGKGIVHRDIKPANILVDHTNEPIVMDFGIARGITESGFTRPGAIVGSIRYMSVEQFRGEPADIGPNLDIYSLGVTLYEVLAGRCPYVGTEHQIMLAITEPGEATPPSAYNPEIPPELDRICAKAIARSRHDRYATMSEFAVELKSFLDSGREARVETATTHDWAEGTGRSPVGPAGGRDEGPPPPPGPGVFPAPDEQGSQGFPRPRRRKVVGLLTLIVGAVGLAWLLAKMLPRGVEEGPVSKSTGMKLIRVAPGSFARGDAEGDPDEAPVKKVTVSKPFAIGQTEVTRGQYRAIVKDAAPGQDEMPVAGITWLDSARFCNAMSRLDGLEPYYDQDGRPADSAKSDGYRLPTETEWEFACRGGASAPAGLRYCFGNDPSRLDEYGLSIGNATSKGMPVRGFKPNSLGIFDMHGNLWEWCADYYRADAYAADETRDPQGPRSGTKRVVRGGSFEDSPPDLRSASRRELDPDQVEESVGFRVARTLPD